MTKQAVFTVDSEFSYDAVVVGGGTTGICAALAAARGGARTAVVESTGYLGGTAVTGLPWLGFHSIQTHTQVVAGIPLEIIERLRSMDAATEFCFDPICGSAVGVNPTMLKLVLAQMCREAGIALHLHSLCTAVETCTEKAQSILIHNKQGCQRISSRVLIDCTDSGDAAAMAGAQWHFGRETDGKVQVASYLLQVGDIDVAQMAAYFRSRPDQLRPFRLEEGELAALIERMPTAPVFVMGAFPEIIAQARAEGCRYPRDRFVGTGCALTGELLLVGSRVEDVNPNDAQSYTEAELTGVAQIQSILDLMRNYLPGCKNARVIGSSHSVGLRETRHILGDYTLTGEDLMAGTTFDDVIALGAYHLDVHSPDHPGLETKKPKVYGVPFRCLLPAGVSGLLIAGRAISANTQAQSSTRVIPISGAQGQAAGEAAAMALAMGVAPREIPVRELSDRLTRSGAILSV